MSRRLCFKTRLSESRKFLRIGLDLVLVRCRTSGVTRRKAKRMRANDIRVGETYILSHRGIKVLVEVIDDRNDQDRFYRWVVRIVGVDPLFREIDIGLRKNCCSRSLLYPCSADQWDEGGARFLLRWWLMQLLFPETDDYDLVAQRTRGRMVGYLESWAKCHGINPVVTIY